MFSLIKSWLTKQPAPALVPLTQVSSPTRCAACLALVPTEQVRRYAAYAWN